MRAVPTPTKVVAFVSFGRTLASVTDTTTFELDAQDRERLAARLAGSMPIVFRASGTDQGLPPAAQRAVEQILTELARGGVVHVLVDDRDVTTQEAADVLGLSRTFVVRLIDSGRLPAHFAGTHRRIRVADLMTYAEERRRRLDAVAAIADADEAAGIDYR